MLIPSVPPLVTRSRKKCKSHVRHRRIEAAKAALGALSGALSGRLAAGSRPGGLAGTRALGGRSRWRGEPRQHGGERRGRGSGKGRLNFLYSDAERLILETHISASRDQYQGEP